VIRITTDFEKYLDNYIKVIIKKGLNLQPEQRLLIMSAFDPGVSQELSGFIRQIVGEAYKSGAKFVEVMWRDDEIELMKFKYGN
jgi:aminopeptidase